MLNFFSKRKGEKGFTLIELLVVIAIIGILATIVLVSLNSARSKARDSRRVSDLRQIALALELYYDDNSAAYPAALDTLATDGYIAVVPNDPQGGAYTYSACGTGNINYSLGALLENTDSTLLDNDVDDTECNISPDGNADDCGDAGEYCIEP